MKRRGRPPIPIDERLRRELRARLDSGELTYRKLSELTGGKVAASSAKQFLDGSDIRVSKVQSLLDVLDLKIVKRSEANG